MTSRGRRLSTPTIILFLGLLVLPVLAVLRLPPAFDPRIVSGYTALASTVTFLLYRRDKQKAQADEWRTPESTLHFADILGGWPGGFLAQRTLRHKTSKTTFQVKFWAIVLVHQIVAFDSLQQWRYFRKILFHVSHGSA